MPKSTDISWIPCSQRGRLNIDNMLGLPCLKNGLDTISVKISSNHCVASNKLILKSPRKSWRSTKANAVTEKSNKQNPQSTWVWATITNCHSLGGLNYSLQLRSPRSSVKRFEGLTRAHVLFGRWQSSRILIPAESREEASFLCPYKCAEDTHQAGFSTLIMQLPPKDPFPV